LFEQQQPLLELSPTTFAHKLDHLINDLQIKEVVGGDNTTKAQQFVVGDNINNG
jgi:hypothetical protein